MPSRLSPSCSSSLRVSTACNVPRTPATAPRMPAVSQRGTRAEEATVAGVARAEIGPEGRDLALERRQRRRDERFLQTKAKVGQQVARLKIVAAVGDEVVPTNQRLSILRPESQRVRFDPHAGIDRSERIAGAVDLERADAIGRMHDLPLQIGEIDPTPAAAR